VTSRRRVFFIAGLAAGLILLSACAGGGADLAPASALPDFLDGAPPRVRDAYRFAIAHPEELEKYPCYCGCGAMGHMDNLDCYINASDAGGNITFDNHAAGCGICVDITQDVMRLMDEGQSAQEIRAYVDATYSAFGPSTDTPLP
jgi:hypothetical protein